MTTAGPAVNRRLLSDPPGQDTRGLDSWLGILCVALAIYAAGFVVTHRALILNRYTDSWWHIAAADEYLRTGVFAKDPFYTDAPPFAPFGLMEFANARVCWLTGLSPKDVLPGLDVFFLILFLVGSFLAGCLVRRKVGAGFASVLVSALVYGYEGPIRTGLAFSTTLPWLTVVIVWMWNSRSSGTRASLMALAQGLLLGVIFDVHVFVGAFGAGAAGVIGLWELGRRITAKDRVACVRWLQKYVVMAVGFLITAWPWVLLQLRVAPHLSGHSSPVWRFTHSVADPEYLLTGLGGFAILLALYAARKFFREERGELTPYLILSAFILALRIPVVEKMIAQSTSYGVADRLTLFLPFGVMAAFLYDECAVLLSAPENRRRLAALALLGAALVLAFPLAYRRVRLNVWLIRRGANLYRQHRYAYLVDELGPGWSRKTILSDPYTSYFARGLIGSYAVCVPAGNASHAVDHSARAALARNALVNGSAKLNGIHIDGIVIDKVNHADLASDPDAQTFADVSSDRVINVWTNSGWRVCRETDHMVLLCPSTP